MKIQHVFFNADPAAPYCDLTICEDKYLFLSGLVSQDLGSGNMLYGDITFETKNILNNLAAILEKYGSDLDHVIRCQVLLKTFAEKTMMNVEYVKHFNPERMPARLCFGDVGLADECKIEIMATAIRK
ncbi:RidA family protein [Clostridium sp. AM58-1XD]|uniref:RidA family protein n=1 Tax=Clostridium sp. AM58-1XD TaxID=2292307 RepID=UPI000E552CF2|nr:RidA family protein [Clostridium sp. AM58-1XD]RGZ00455.1 RidA family protein [Clostridium sp. AM58-1XD]